MAKPRRLGDEGPREDRPAASSLPADPESVARSILLRQLTASAKSRAQLTQALADRNVDAAVAERVLDRFAQVGLIDDRAFAVQWVESRTRTRGLSRRALQAELSRKGIAADDQASALALLSDDDQLEAARGFARKRASGLSNLDEGVAVRRLAGALARRGHPAGLCLEVAREVLAEVRA